MQEQVRAFAFGRGASLVGFAAAAGFQDAPEGYRPIDLLPSARGVVVLAKALPKGVVETGNAAVYTLHHGHLMQQLDTLAYEVAVFLESLGAVAMPLPADDPYFHWEPERRHGIGLFSHRHAAVKAGLGAIGRSALLITPQFGNRVELVSVLTTLPFPPAPQLESLCLPGCTRCVDACPSGAQSGSFAIEQKPCREHIAARTDRGHAIYRCWQCRSVCPA
jgi:epoxyqueuosine reductase QueG